MSPFLQPCLRPAGWNVEEGWVGASKHLSPGGELRTGDWAPGSARTPQSRGTYRRQTAHSETSCGTQIDSSVASALGSLCLCFLQQNCILMDSEGFRNVPFTKRVVRRARRFGRCMGPEPQERTRQEGPGPLVSGSQNTPRRLEVGSCSDLSLWSVRICPVGCCLSQTVNTQIEGWAVTLLTAPQASNDSGFS